MMWWSNDIGWGGWIVMVLAMLAFWALVVVATIALFRGSRSDKPTQLANRDPMQILDERFARGEIDVDEYRARQDVLRAAVR